MRHELLVFEKWIFWKITYVHDRDFCPKFFQCQFFSREECKKSEACKKVLRKYSILGFSRNVGEPCKIWASLGKPFQPFEKFVYCVPKLDRFENILLTVIFEHSYILLKRRLKKKSSDKRLVKFEWYVVNVSALLLFALPAILWSLPFFEWDS